MRKLRVLVLMHEDNVPPESLEGYTDKEVLDWKAEYDVVTTLRERGHEVRPLGVRSDLGVIRDTIEEWESGDDRGRVSSTWMKSISSMVNGRDAPRGPAPGARCRARSLRTG